MSKNYKDTANYLAAKQNASAALGLTVTSTVYALGIAAFLIGLIEGFCLLKVITQTLLPSYMVTNEYEKCCYRNNRIN